VKFENEEKKYFNRLLDRGTLAVLAGVPMYLKWEIGQKHRSNKNLKKSRKIISVIFGANSEKGQSMLNVSNEIEKKF
jgi:hypothetical protein